MQIDRPERSFACIRYESRVSGNAVAMSSITVPAPERGSMAMFLFTVLNGLGVVFLVYALIQFGKERHRSTQLAARNRVIEFSLKSKPTVVVVTQPISTGGRVGLPVIYRQAPTSGRGELRLHRSARSVQ
jgi:hypothetical protein